MVEMTRLSKGIRRVDKSCRRPSLAWAAIVAIALNGAASHAFGQQVSAAPAVSGTGKPATPSQPSPSSDPGRTTEYLINPQDVLLIDVFGEPQFSCECSVTPEGTIAPPLLKPLQAAGLTPEALSEVITQDLRESNLMSDPQVRISIKSSPLSFVTVGGAVRIPQVIPTLSRTNLLQVLSQAQGLADDAGGTLSLTRGALGLRAAAREGKPLSPTVYVDLKKLMDGSEPNANLDVLPGDHVVVPHAGVFYVLGEVNRPGGYNLKDAQEQVSILQALSIAGDLTAIAKAKKAVLIRKDPKASGGHGQIALNLQDILAGRASDPQVLANDVLYVPPSRRKRAIRGFTAFGQSAAPMATSGAIVYRR
jgi:polysaccharide biosynthesis/export protein